MFYKNFNAHLNRINHHPPAPKLKKEQGVAFILLLSAIFITVSIVTVSRLSLNNLQTASLYKEGKVMRDATQLLLGYSAATSSILGQLPCPDTDFPADGIENRSGSDCNAQVGWLPYKTMNTEPIADSSGTPFWYAVSSSYSNGSISNSLNPTQVVNLTVNNESASAVVIAPRAALSNQNRNQFQIQQYLEDENSNNTLDVYNQSISDSNNDRLAFITSEDQWAIVQRQLLIELAELLNNYKLACGEYPWAADVASASDDSVVNLQAGIFPLSNALPHNWGTGCAAALLPDPNLINQWQNHIFYSFCTTGEGSCIELTGDTNDFVSSILIAPGTPLIGQSRLTMSLTQLFELENSDGSTPFSYFKTNNLSLLFNDVTHVVAP